VLALAHEGPISGAVVVEALHHGLELLVAHHTVAVEIDLADDLSSMLLAAHDGDQLAGGDASCDTPQERETERERGSAGRGEQTGDGEGPEPSVSKCWKALRMFSSRMAWFMSMVAARNSEYWISLESSSPSPSMMWRSSSFNTSNPYTHTPMSRLSQCRER
jgi:hypothetical protein